MATREGLAVPEAREQILARFAPGSVESVALAAALGRTLAADIIADGGLPPFTHSAMDGYAVRAADIVAASSAAPIALCVVGIQTAGSRVSRAIHGGEAMRIVTGAPIPAGADTVVRVEETDGGTERVAIHAAVSPGANVRRQGETMRAGRCALAAGTLLGPAAIALLAALGCARPAVVRPPRVAILSTGDELVASPESPRYGQIPDANGPMLAALVAQAGGDPLPLGIAPDRPDDLRRALATVDAADLIVTSGGVSVGPYDAVRTVLMEHGRVDFWRVRMKPGRPVAFGSIGRTPVLALPGNPAAAFVAFTLFGLPAIRRMLGRTPVVPPTVPVRLRHAVANPGGQQAYLFARLHAAPTGWEADTTLDQGSANLLSLARAEALVMIPEGVTDLAAGERAQAQRWDVPGT